jgi:hypothetical protein
MKNPSLMLAAALVLVVGTAHHANALSVGHSDFANSDGSSKFSDPDDQYQNLFSPNGQSTVLPLANGPTVTWGATRNAAPTPPAHPCSGAGTANCKGN